MKADPICPVCEENQWEVLRQFHYTPSMNNGGGDYERSRMRVLFDLWNPGVSQMDLSAILCTRCGYATYRPRPSQEEIETKFRLQQREFPEILGVTANRDAQRLDRKRAEKVYRRLQPFFPEGGLRVLDFGGGDGKLISPFLERGHECFVVDYNEHPAPGIRRLCSTVSEIPSNLGFDVILCSHVLEHQADPAEILHELTPHLSAGGLLYGEVPQELFGGIPIERDPVTHIGFFAGAGTLNVLLERADLEILACRSQLATYNEQTLHIVWAVGRKASKRLSPHYAAALSEARHLLHPSALARLLRNSHPYCLWGRVRKHFHYHHPARKFVRRWVRWVQGKLTGTS